MLTGFLRTAAVVAIVAAGGMTSHAAVYSPQQQLAAPVIEAFKADPSQLLKQFPVGGDSLAFRVRDLAASDPSTLSALVALLKSADPQAQVPAIARGLALVARLAITSDPTYSTTVQTAVAESQNQRAIETFTREIGDTATAAIGGGGGGAGAGGGSGTGGGTSAPSANGGGGGGADQIGGRNYPTLRSETQGGSVNSLAVNPSPI